MTSSNRFTPSSTFTASNPNPFTSSNAFTPSLIVNYNDDEKEKGIYETYSLSQTVSYIFSVTYSTTQRITYFYSNTMTNEQMTNTLFSTIEKIYNRIIIQRLIPSYIEVLYSINTKNVEQISGSLIIMALFLVLGVYF